MPATIVYDGVGNGGTLFQGKKFWVAQRVPARTRWIDLIKVNGGEIVPLEKSADILIADHARKDIPPGSYSWTYIEQSVKNGALEPLEKHVAGPPAGTIRQVGSALPARKGRNPFTAADDRILAEWVTNAERKGAAVKGNILYQDLEAAYPHHSYQSWRDRWLKYVQYNPRSNMDEEKVDPLPTPLVRPQQIKAQIIMQLDDNSSISPTRRSMVNAASEQRSPKTASHYPVPAVYEPFTVDEFDLLQSLYDDIMNIDEASVGAAWTTWAKQNPQHTAEEWLDFWECHVKPFRHNQSSTTVIKQLEHESSNLPAVSGAEEVPISKHESHKSGASASRIGEPDKTAFNNTAINSPAPPSSMFLGSDSASLYSSSRDISSQKSSDEQDMKRHRTSKEARLKHDLEEFAEAQGYKVDFYPLVCGRRIPLIELWHVVQKPDFGGFDRVEAAGKWPDVAAKLEFDMSNQSEASDRIRTLYDNELLDFAKARAQWRKLSRSIANTGDGLQEANMMDVNPLSPRENQRQEAALKTNSTLDTRVALEIEANPVVPSFVPRRAHNIPSGYNRQGEPMVTRRKVSDDLELSPLTTKRKRIDKGKEKLWEIPATPENMIGVRIKSGYTAFSSPPQKSRQGHREVDVLGKDGEGIQEDEIHFEHPHSRNIFTMEGQRLSPRKRLPEPETQDFEFSTMLPEEETEDAALQPSQQEEYSPSGKSLAAEAGDIQEDSSTQSQAETQHNERELQDYIDGFVAIGYSEEIVRQSLFVTTLETGDAGTVMEALTGGLGIPANIQGVWTANDDVVVRLPAGTDNGQYRKLQIKHGEDRCVKRRQFLADTEEIVGGQSQTDAVI